MPTVTWQIKAPHFCAAIVTHGHAVMRAAPIVGWMRKLRPSEMAAYCRRKGWTMKLVGVEA